MDITAALSVSGPTSRVGKCLVQKRLDEIPEDTEGRTDLIAALESSEWSAPMLGQVFQRLNLPVSMTTIRLHRSNKCACYLAN